MTSIQQIESILVTAGASIAKIASESDELSTKVLGSNVNNQIAGMMLMLHMAKNPDSEAKGELNPV